MAKSVTFIATVPNTKKGMKQLTEIKATAKRLGKLTRVLGRCKNRRDAFKATKRYFGRGTDNDIYLNSPQAPYCYAWVVYYR